MIKTLKTILLLGILGMSFQMSAVNNTNPKSQRSIMKESKDLIVNSSLEISYRIWKISYYWAGKTSYVKDAKLAHRGKGCMKLAATEKNGKYWGRIYKQTRAKDFTGRRFNYSIWVKGKGELLLGVIKCSYRKNKKGFKAKYFWQRTPVKLTGEWQKVDYGFTITNPDVYMLRVALEVGGKGSEVYIDDSKCTTISNTEVTFETPHKGHMVVPDGTGINLSYKLLKSKKAFSGQKLSLYIIYPDGSSKTASGVTDSNGVYIPSPQKIKLDKKGVWRIICSDLKSYASTETVINVTDKASYDKMNAIAKGVKIEKPLHILYLGDSLTDFHRGHNYADKIDFWINKYNPGKESFLNAGVGGDFITRVWSRILGIKGKKEAYRQNMYSDLFDKQPNIVFISLGHNDTKADSKYNYQKALVSPATQDKTYRKLIKYIQSKTNAKIVLLTSTSSVVPLCRAYAEKRAKTGKRHEMFGRPEKLEAFNKVIKKLAKDLNLDYIDVYNPTKNHPDKASLFSPKDGIHLNEKGNSFIAMILLKYLSGKKVNTDSYVKKAKGFSFIDFGKAANMALKDEKANDKKGGWFDQGPNNDLGKLPDGVQNFNGVDYKISQSGKAAVVLRGHTLSFLPLDSGPIEIKRKAELIYFLTACGWNTSIDNKVAFVTVRYKQGGLYLDIPVRFKKETAGWWKPENIPNADIAWRGQNGSAEVGVYSFGWINPYPDQEIDSITFVSTNSSAVPAFIAATIVDDKTIADKLKSGLQAKIQKMANQDKNSGNAILKVDFNTKGIPVSDDAASLSVGFGISPDYLTASQGLVKAGKGKPFFRLQIGLAKPSPAEGVWDFKRLDQYIDYIYATGGKPMLCFGPTGPIWMATPVNGISMRRNWRPQNLEEYAKYCEAIVRRYNIERKTPVKWWQIGNETELKGWSYKYYVKVYKFIAPRLKKIDPTIVIGGPVNCSPNIGWAGELLREAGSMVDFLSYHQYGYSEPFDSPSNYVMKKTPKYMSAVTRYRKQTLKLAKNRNLPVIVTEANTNPRYQRPAGTDPRIRTMFNAAWYTSALSQFVLGGGRSMCYFTIDGGFGACHYRRKGFTLFPVYHAIWLFRKLAHGRITAVKSSSPMVEAYAFQDGKSKRLIVINKMATPVKVELEFNSSPGKGQIFVLNSANAKACSLLDNKKKIRFLTPQKADWNNKKTTLNMEAYEVIGWEAEK